MSEGEKAMEVDKISDPDQFESLLLKRDEYGFGSYVNWAIYPEVSAIDRECSNCWTTVFKGSPITLVKHRVTALGNRVCRFCAIEIACTQCGRQAGPFAELVCLGDDNESGSWTWLMCPGCARRNTEMSSNRELER